MNRDEYVAVKVVRRASPKYIALQLHTPITLGSGEDKDHGIVGDYLLTDAIQGTMHIIRERHLSTNYERVEDVWQTNSGEK